MTQEAFNQIIEAARHGDVFAQTALGIILCEGKIVQPNLEHGLGWLKMHPNATAFGQGMLMLNILSHKVNRHSPLLPME